MNSHRLLRQLVLFACLASWVQPVSAAALVDCRLIMDGSSQPPGDRIDCVVSRTADDPKLRLEVVAYLIEPGKSPTPLRAKADRNHDDNGLLLVRLDVPDKDPTTSCSLVVPYADMAIGAGEHELGYVVTLRSDDAIVWTKPLPATRVRVGGMTRTELKPQTLGSQGRIQPSAVEAIVRKGSTSASPRRVQLGELPRPATTTKSQSVAVPGGFERTPAPPQPIANPELAALASQPWQPLSSVADTENRVVYFGTNRAQLVATDPTRPLKRLMFGAEFSSTLTVGQCTVNFPVRHHTRGELEEPNWWQNADPETCFLVETVELLNSKDFTANFDKSDVLLFVHGFNTSFDDAVLRAGQIQYDAEFPGKVMSFTWPSAGAMDQYKPDAQKAEQSYRALGDLLDLLVGAKDGTSRGRGHLHVIAHSLGNRVFLGALHDLVSRDVWKTDEKYLGQVILAAPDVGASRFNNVIGYALGAADRLTYYYCRGDVALATSQTINNYEPVGLYPYFESGLDTINADGVETNFLNHGYYASAPQVLSDLHLLLRFAYGPTKRMPPLTTHARVYGHDHWSFLPVDIKEQ